VRAVGLSRVVITSKKTVEIFRPFFYLNPNSEISGYSSQ
jgi:hypothetical protein